MSLRAWWRTSTAHVVERWGRWQCSVFGTVRRRLIISLAVVVTFLLRVFGLQQSVHWSVSRFSDLLNVLAWTARQVGIALWPVLLAVACLTLTGSRWWPRVVRTTHRVRAAASFQRLLTGLLVLALLAVLCAAVFVLPRRLVTDGIADGLQESKLGLENDVRTTLLQGVGGLLLVAGAVATARQVRISREQLAVTSEGQITERFTRAIDQLGKEDKLSVRLGGIYALERIADNSVYDSGPVAQVLVAYVHERCPWPPAGVDRARLREEQGELYFARALLDWQSSPAADMPDLQLRHPDVQAIMTVLGRRKGFSMWRIGPDVYRSGLDLTDLDLRKVDLLFANLRGADFSRSNLQEAQLPRADLEGATLINVDLWGANLQDTNLRKADLSAAFLRQTSFYRTHLQDAHLRSVRAQRADFQQADLRGVDLGAADLRGAFFSKVDLRGADLRGANFSHAHIDESDLAGATADLGTRWPEGFDVESTGVTIEQRKAYG